MVTRIGVSRNEAVQTTWTGLRLELEFDNISYPSGHLIQSATDWKSFRPIKLLSKLLSLFVLECRKLTRDQDRETKTSVL